jgi:hypothetical protein
MKALLLLVIFSIALLIAGFYLTRQPASVPRAYTSRSILKENRRTEAAGMARAYNDVREAEPRVIDQGATDFASGEAYNLVAEGHSLRLAPDAPVPLGTDDTVGVYVWPVRQIKTPEQQRHEAFDTIHFEYDIAASAEALRKAAKEAGLLRPADDACICPAARG